MSSRIIAALEIILKTRHISRHADGLNFLEGLNGGW